MIPKQSGAWSIHVEQEKRTTSEGVFCPRWSIKQVKHSLKILELWECLEVKRINFHKMYKVIHYYPKPIEIIGCGL